MGCTGIKICELHIPNQVISINKTLRLVNMALEMMRFTKHFITNKGKKLKLKIGIHQGDVIAGVIGDHKPQFSLIGDTVNTTSRVCSTGDCGEITLSEEAMKNLNIWDFHVKKKTVEAKGKGSINVYQIKKRNTKTAARFQKITGLILKKIRGEKQINSSNFSSFIKHSSVTTVVNLLRFHKTRNNEANVSGTNISDPNSIIIANSQKEIQNRVKVINANLNESNRGKVINANLNESRKLGKAKMYFQKPLKLLLNLEDAKFNDKKTFIKFNSKIISEKGTTLKKKPEISYTHAKNQILPLKNKIDTTAIESKDEENLLSERSLYFFNYGKKQFLEFVKQLVQKHTFVEKIMLFTLFFFSLFRNFLLLALIDFFDMMHFLVFEGFFLVFLGYVLIFLREFYQKIHKKHVLKLTLFTIFLLGFISKILELFHSQLQENYSSLFMNIVILHLIISNIWYCFSEFSISLY